MALCPCPIRLRSSRICGISSRERPSLRAVRVVEGGVCGTAGGVRAAYHSPGCLRYRHLGGDPRPTGDHVREPETHYTRGKDGHVAYQVVGDGGAVNTEDRATAHRAGSLPRWD